MEKKNEILKNLAQLKFFIMGAARSGISAAKILKKFKAQVFITENGIIPKEVQAELIQNDISFESQGHSVQKILNECDVLVVSPGIPLHQKIPFLARKHGIIIVSEIELTSWFLSDSDVCVGITGTNGKSTTTNYVSQLFIRAGWNSVACGNIGKSFSQSVLNEMELENGKNIYAVELSSYQLETTYSFSPICSVILNLQADHMERYQKTEEYLKAKWRLVLMTKKNGLVILDEDVFHLSIKLGFVLPLCRIVIFTKKKIKNKFNLKRSVFLKQIEKYNALPFALYHELKTLDFSDFVNGPRIHYVSYAYDETKGSVEIECQDDFFFVNWKIQNPCLPGEHNALNILCASLIGKHLGIDENLIKEQWENGTSTYLHLPHRLEKIKTLHQCFTDAKGNRKHVTIINDSKATNVESTLVALASFQNPIRLLLGGEPKGDSYSPISSFFGKNVVKIYPFGKASDVIETELKEFGTQFLAEASKQMRQAAELALEQAQDGDVILLSPGCSSFDEFKDFEHRGNTFRNWALSHCEGNEK